VLADKMHPKTAPITDQCQKIKIVCRESERMLFLAALYSLAKTQWCLEHKGGGILVFSSSNLLYCVCKFREHLVTESARSTIQERVGIVVVA
jgi:hypothetical protein